MAILSCIIFFSTNHFSPPTPDGVSQLVLRMYVFMSAGLIFVDFLFCSKELTSDGTFDLLDAQPYAKSLYAD